MKLLNLELFISKALTLDKFSVNFYVFIVVQDSRPGPPPSKMGSIQHQPSLGFDLAVI